MGKKKSEYWQSSDNDGDWSESKSQRQSSRFRRGRKGPKGLGDVEYSENDGYGMEDIGSEAWRYDSDEWEENFSESALLSDEAPERDSQKGKKRKRG